MTHLLLGLALTIAAPGPKDKEKPAATLEGVWAVEKIEGKGDKEVANVTFTFTADKVSIKEGAKERVENAGYTSDATKKPAHIDIKPDRGNKDMAILGIYEIDGDNLKICFTADGGTRPTEFKADKDARTVLVVL